ncbi:hypothetical protein HQQ80_15760 [Microbacteriaceae bacterium VKM Ac-2855]|nr:hypothetical protein [Microbacteriaceae bacterium VKM Ac-2855]
MPGTSDAVATVAARVEVALTGSSVMLALALVVVLAVILPSDRRRTADATR